MTEDTNGTSTPRSSRVSGQWLERLATLGVRGVLTLGTVAAWIVMLFTGLEVPKEYVWFVFGVSGWLLTAEVLRGLSRLGK